MRRFPMSAAALALLSLALSGGAHAQAPPRQGPYFLPTGAAAKELEVARQGPAAAGVTILTEAVAVKETGPPATLAKFGEVYAFNPNFIAVQRDQPTQLEFWNLQPDDEHDVALVAPDSRILMYQRLAPLQKIAWVFTFHREGLYQLKCLRHQPAMSGQILVLPRALPAARKRTP